MSAILENFTGSVEQIVRKVIVQEMQQLQIHAVRPPEEVLTIPAMAKRLHISKETAYEWAARPGFPLYDMGERTRKVIWSDVIDWVRMHIVNPG